MPEAVIVATARTPIGRAFKGSLKDVRPDDLALAAIQAVLAKVPNLDPAELDDLYLGCAEPWGEQGMNMARVVAVLAGLDHLPGATVNRFCASSVQTTRMAFHAIKAGEGDAFLSAGVECVSRYKGFAGAGQGTEDWLNPLFADAQARTAAYAASNDTWHDPRQDGQLPDVYAAMGQTAENVATLARHLPRAPGRVGRREPEPGREGDRRRVLRPRDHAGHDAGRHGRQRRRLPPPGRDPRGRGRAAAGVPAGRHRHGRQLLPAQRRRGRARGHERHQGARPRPDAARPGRRDRGQRALARDHGPRPGRGLAPGARPGRDDHRRHRPGRDQRGLRGPGAAVGRRPRHRPRQAQRAGRRDRAGPSRSA